MDGSYVVKKKHKHRFNILLGSTKLRNKHSLKETRFRDINNLYDTRPLEVAEVQ